MLGEQRRLVAFIHPLVFCCRGRFRPAAFAAVPGCRNYVYLDAFHHESVGFLYRRRQRQTDHQLVGALSD